MSCGLWYQVQKYSYNRQHIGVPVHVFPANKHVLLTGSKEANMVEQHKAYYASEIGTLEIVGTAHGILSVRFAGNTGGNGAQIHECLQPCVRQLDEYFCGRRREFSIPVRLQGTDFERRIWKDLRRIPYGRTRSYSEIAREIGDEKAARAVGNTARKNPLAIIVPCHRVIGKDGKLTGYAGGLWRKEWLLKHEENH